MTPHAWTTSSQSVCAIILIVHTLFWDENIASVPQNSLYDGQYDNQHNRSVLSLVQSDDPPGPYANQTITLHARTTSSQSVCTIILIAQTLFWDENIASVPSNSLYDDQYDSHDQS